MFKKRLKHLAALFAGGLALLAIALMLVVWHSGASSIQDWIGLQIQDIANSFLTPRLSFTDLSYKYPLTVSLKNLRLTSDDPARPGKTIDIIACNEAVLSLGEIPSRGKPIIIEKIVLNGPLITAKAIDARSNQFVGFSNLMRNPSTKTPEKKQEDDKKLSDVFRMRLVQLTDGQITYDPRIPGTLPMKLDKINTTLTIAPTSDGWYKLDTLLSRKPVFETRLAGELNLDTFSTRDLDVKIAADLGADKLDYLPPELQVLLKQYEARGKLKLEVTGAVAVNDPLHANAKINLNVDGANFAYGGLRIPVQNLELAAEYADGKATLDSLKMAMLNGSVALSGSVLLNDRLDSVLHLNIAHIVPEKLLADQKLASANPASLGLDFNLAASLTSLLGRAPPKPGEPLAAIALQNLRIFAADPRQPGKTVDIVACKNLDVAMSQPILPGKPIVIDKIILDQPIVNAISTEPGAATFVGVPNLPPELAAPTTQPASTEPAIPADQMLTDLLQIKTFQLNGAKISLDQRLANTLPMVIDSISTALVADAKSPGLHAIRTQISQPPAFNLSVDGTIDLNHPSLQHLKLDLEADLTHQDYSFLPPRFQLLAKQSQASGKLSLKADVSASLADLPHSTATIDLNADKLQIHQGDLKIPVDNLSLSATLANGKFTENARIAALQNVFEMSATAMLNEALDTDATLKLKDVEIEKLLALIDPTKPPLKTSTKITADIEIKTPVMVFVGGIAPAPNQPIAAVAIHNLRLTTDDPITPGKPLDFVAVDELSTSLAALPTPGKPAIVDHVTITHPILRAVAMTPGSPDFAGIANLQAIANNLPSSPQPQTTKPETRKLSTLIQLKSLNVTDFSLLYNPRIDNTIPMTLDHLSTQITLDSPAGEAYRFALKIPQNVALSGDIAGRINVDTLRVDPLTLTLAVACGSAVPGYLPPQIQQLLKPYNMTARVGVSATTAASLDNPAALLTSATGAANIVVDDFVATFGDYRIPVPHIRLPLQLKNGQLTILKSDSLGGPMVEVLAGTINVTGTMQLNDRLDSTLDIAADDLLLQDLATAKITPPPPDVIGNAKATIKLINAPLLVIAAKAQPPATRPSDPPQSPLASQSLPDHWGNADIELTHAHLAGLELVQGVTNLAKSVFTDIFERDKAGETRAVEPKESASLICDFNGDHIDCSTIHYEGEVVAADGKGFITVEQNVNLDLAGGPMSKLGGLGSVGNWIKEASDSLLYYHVYGSIGKLEYQIKTGDGHPIVQGVKKGAEAAEHGIKAGANAVGGFFHNLTHHDSDDDKK